MSGSHFPAKYLFRDFPDDNSLVSRLTSVSESG